MHAILRRIWQTSIIGNLVAGSLVVLPFVLTVLIIGWAINWIMAAFGPGSWFGDILTTGGEALIGPQREWLAFLIGTVIVLIILWLFGWAVRTRAQRTLQHVLDDALTKVPLFRAVYRPVSQVVRLFAGSNAGERRLLVYLPTSPLPAWGGLVLVPESSVIPVPDMDADALIKLYFSFGVLAPETIPRVTERIEKERIVKKHREKKPADAAE
jgi:uncharacterized membrane protein